jgi:hypothetical protein
VPPHRQRQSRTLHLLAAPQGKGAGVTIQRYGFSTEGSLMPNASGPFVLHTDHIAAVAEAEQRGYERGIRMAQAGFVGSAHYAQGQRDALAKRTLTADDAEPAVGSVVLDANGDAFQRGFGGKWGGNGYSPVPWKRLFISGPITLIHDGGAE